MARATMAELITTLRGNAAVSTSDITVGGVTYWSDDQLEDILDREKSFFVVQLKAYPHLEDGSYVYRRWGIPKTVGSYLESPVVRTLTGYVISDSDYTLDENAGLVIFAADATAGYTLEGYTYNMDEASAKVWEAKAGQRADFITMKSGSHQLYQDQEWQHCMDMAKKFRGKSGIKYVKLRMTDYG